MSPATWPRAQSLDERLLVVDPASDRFEAHHVRDLARFVSARDLVVLNDAATFPASLRGVTAAGSALEARLLVSRDGTWRAVLFGAGDWRTRTEDRPPPPAAHVGDAIVFAGELRARVEHVARGSERLVDLRFEATDGALWSAIYGHGRPVQYAHMKAPLALWHVQTSFASRPWASEMPSAARPLAWELVLALRARGVRFATLTHAAGLSSSGDAQLDAALPLRESFEVPAETIQAVDATRAAGGRVIAVGTSVVRALESAVLANATSGETDLLVNEHHTLRAVDALFTGMHEPGTSHDALLHAFARDSLLSRAYAHAVSAGFVGHEFGDSMLLARGALGGASGAGRGNSWRMLRFLHTADWQLGLKLAFVAGDAGAVARFQRFEVIRRIAAIAKERAVDAIVVAGDVLDDNAIGEDSLQRARDALSAFAPLPVLLLPGNHDAATPDCALRRLRAGDHVHTMLDDAPFVLPNARFHPCPLRRRHERDDPSRALPKREAGDPILVAIAHGALIDFTEGLESKNVIDWRALLAKGYDYLALGDWHGTLSFDPRVWYSGAPEATRFKEKRPGNVLLVEIDAPGSVPRVEEIAVARTRWVERRFDLADDAGIDEVARFLAAIEEPSMTLVSLTLAGHVSLGARTKLDAVIAGAQSTLMHVRLDASDLHDRRSEDDLRALAVDGFVGRAAESLRARGTPESEDALRLLHRLAIEEQR